MENNLLKQTISSWRELMYYLPENNGCIYENNKWTIKKIIVCFCNRSAKYAEHTLLNRIVTDVRHKERKEHFVGSCKGTIMHQKQALDILLVKSLDFSFVIWNDIEKTRRLFLSQFRRYYFCLLDRNLSWKRKKRKWKKKKNIRRRK